MYATPKVKFVFDRRKRASKTTNGAIEIEVCFAGQRVRLSTGIGVHTGEWSDGKVVKRLDAQILNRVENPGSDDPLSQADLPPLAKIALTLLPRIKMTPVDEMSAGDFICIFEFRFGRRGI